MEPNCIELKDFLYTRGKYFRVDEPYGVRRLSKLFEVPEEDVRRALRSCGFTLLIRIPISAYWLREEIIPGSRDG